MTTRDGEPAAASENAPAPDEADKLRRQAEERLDGLSAAAAAAAASPVPVELTAAVHELRVHQIELEMQNEELRRAQHELDAQREKYFDLFDLAPVGYLTLNDTSVVRDANLTAASLLGVERQRLVGLPFTAFVLAPDRDVYYRLLRMLKQTAEPQTCELRLLRFGGEAEATAGAGGGAGAGGEAAPGHFWAHLESRPRRGADGETLSSWVTFSDIGARLRAEEALRESVANFRAFFDAIDDIVVVATPDGRLVYANPAVSAKLGYSAAELTALRVLDLHPPDKRREAEAIFAAMFRGERESCPLPLQARSGALVPVETRVWFGRWDGAECMFGVSKDLTTEQEALQKFDRLFRGNPALMAVSSLPDRRFTEVNEAYLSALGYSRAEVLGKTSEELGLAVDPEQQLALAKQLQAQGRISDRELKVRRKDGAILDGLFSGEVIESQGRQYFLTVMIDHTERKRAEEALRESEEKYRTVADFAYDWEAWRAPDGAYRYVSPSCERITGHAAAELLADANLLVQITHPDDQSKVIAHEYAVAHQAQGQDLAYGFRILTPSGETRWIGHSCTAVYGEGGQWLGRRETNRDITDRKQAEDALREKTALLSGLLTSIPDIVFFKDGQGVYLGCNPEFARFVGRDVAGVVGATDHELFGKEVADFFREQDRVMMVRGKPRHNEEWIDYPDGARILIDTLKAPLRDADGRIIGLLGVSRDITARKQAEEALRLAGDRLALAARAGGVGVWDYDTVNDTLTWDEQMFALYGITREQFGGAYEAWQAGLHPEDRERGDAEIQAALRGEKELDTGFRVLWPDGTIHDIRALALVQRDASGRATHMIGTNWDISAEKRAEEEVRQRNQELARMNDELVDEAAALAEANATITRIAATDDLTGLANRRCFYESLEKAVSLARRHGSPLALVSFDLDGLKRVNDGAGHEAGDEVLASFAALLAALCRTEDLPARLGGDEFSLLLPGIELGGAGGLAERLLVAVRSYEALAQHGVTVSAGVAQWTPGELPDDLLRRADEALYTAKRGGGDAVAGGA